MSPKLELQPGTRIRVTQRIERREGDWCSPVEGEVLAAYTEKTGSWYAHAKDARLWLSRIRLRKDNGEITTLALDRFSEVELLAPPSDN